jgi:hypothetical protein
MFELVSDKLIGKIDWNIDNHKLSFKHSYVKAEQFSRSFFCNCSFDNGSQLFESVTNSTSLELNSRFGNKFSNNLVVAYTNVADDRNASGILFHGTNSDGQVDKVFFFGQRFLQQIY